jgi:hypothetical protein
VKKPPDAITSLSKQNTATESHDNSAAGIIKDRLTGRYKPMRNINGFVPKR